MESGSRNATLLELIVTVHDWQRAANGLSGKGVGEGNLFLFYGSY